MRELQRKQECPVGYLPEHLVNSAGFYKVQNTDTGLNQQEFKDSILDLLGMRLPVRQAEWAHHVGY